MKRSSLGWITVVLPAILVVAVRLSLGGWALYSEEEVLDANVRHPLFTTDEHFIEKYWRPNMTQRDRLESLTETVQKVTEAFDKLGAKVFLESASLIGWWRHDEGHVPWDSDADLGITVEECKRSGVTKTALVAAIDASLVEVVKFACSCEEDCEGENRRMVGRFTNKRTGVCVDVFSYAPVQELRDWQQIGDNAKIEWLERVNDHADFTFPNTSLLPLQSATWNGFDLLIPSDPAEFLSWEYGRCLAPHTWPWRLMLYTPTHFFIPMLAALKSGLLVSAGSVFAIFLGSWDAAVTAMAYGVTENGILALVLLAQAGCQLGWGLLEPRMQDVAAIPFWAVWFTMVLIILLDLNGIIGGVACQIDDYYLRPRRPKTWTLCVAGYCWDF